MRTLVARFNRLKELPESIGQLANLKELDIGGNDLATLPASVVELTNLRTLQIFGNPSLNLPPEIDRQVNDPLAVLSFYFSRLNDEEALNEAKILLVGDGEVGKTSLVKRLIDGEFFEDESVTRGVRIRRWSFAEHGDPIQANVWDFGGQDIYHATHQFFLSERSLYILVVSSRGSESHTRIDYWLKTIANVANNAPVLIVANKSDQHVAEIDWNNLQRKYPAIRDVIRRVSCKTGEGIDEARNLIQKEVRKLDHVNTPIPKSWFAVKNRLEIENSNYQSFPEFKTLCMSEGIEEPTSQRTLLGLLNDLGIALHYRGSRTLEETNVLKPDWVTGGFYRIIDGNQEAGDSVLDRSRLEHLLPDDEYPADKKEFILGMLQQFELCFSFDNGNKFLIPGLLPFEEPETGAWDDVLLLVYQYDLLPTSVISRLIMRMHGHLLSNNGKLYCWRTGAVFISDDRKNEAHVRADGSSNQIVISVRGFQEGRRYLMTEIRSQIKEIHGNTIKAAELVPAPGNHHVLVSYDHLRTLERMKKRSFVPEGLEVEVSVKEMLDGYQTIEKPIEATGRSHVEHNHYYSPVHMGDNNMSDKINVNNSNLTNSIVGKNQTVSDCLKVIHASNQDKDVQEELKNVVASVNQLLAELVQNGESDETRETVEDDLTNFVKEAAKSKPRPKMLSATADGLIEAAKKVAAFAVPVSKSVQAVLDLLINSQ